MSRCTARARARRERPGGPLDQGQRLRGGQRGRGRGAREIFALEPLHRQVGVAAGRGRARRSGRCPGAGARRAPDLAGEARDIDLGDAVEQLERDLLPEPPSRARYTVPMAPVPGPVLDYEAFADERSRGQAWEATGKAAPRARSKAGQPPQEPPRRGAARDEVVEVPCAPAPRAVLAPAAVAVTVRDERLVVPRHPGLEIAPRRRAGAGLGDLRGQPQRRTARASSERTENGSRIASRGARRERRVGQDDGEVERAPHEERRRPGLRRYATNRGRGARPPRRACPAGAGAARGRRRPRSAARGGARRSPRTASSRPVLGEALGDECRARSRRRARAPGTATSRARPRGCPRRS